ncbi:MAG: hypothetical protein E6R03_14830 [Hyphomicrobiaceae bacterium]|nr:MAG: hypothetical protein E6R03_14830 [Hyphomicrobiaceae bacterium]
MTTTDLAAHIEAFSVAEKDLSELVDEAGTFKSLQDYRSLMERHQRASRSIRTSEAFIAWSSPSQFGQAGWGSLKRIRQFVATQTGEVYDVTALEPTTTAEGYGFFIELKRLIPTIKQLAWMQRRYHSFKLHMDELAPGRLRFGWSGYMDGDRYEKFIDVKNLNQESLLDTFSSRGANKED